MIAAVFCSRSALAALVPSVRLSSTGRGNREDLGVGEGAACNMARDVLSRCRTEPNPWNYGQRMSPPPMGSFCGVRVDSRSSWLSPRSRCCRWVTPIKDPLAAFSLSDFTKSRALAHYCPAAASASAAG
uniref:Secreted protein n=1 Tax=Peronospora matthiolae TaxID=2874970 RepID=A0AAV1VM11_9STRA